MTFAGYSNDFSSKEDQPVHKQTNKKKKEEPVPTIVRDFTNLVSGRDCACLKGTIDGLQVIDGKPTLYIVDSKDCVGLALVRLGSKAYAPQRRASSHGQWSTTVEAHPSFVQRSC